ncbi:MAG: DNA polymerase III subunit delta' [Hyphomonadaceae bacterium]|nr:DNA polymerase III subunit delta' [Hyphomonadaceae bacterium]
MSAAELPDQEIGTAHPSTCGRFIGHLAAETELAHALAQQRLHHAWLLQGPRGVGKATLAYRFAAALLGARLGGERPLDAVEGDPVARRVSHLVHPDLFRLTRTAGDTGKLRRDIVVDDVRALQRFFTLHPVEGGRRVVLLDCADELNRNAANALLKMLEEPPRGAVLLLICHSLGAVLPTLRSRCVRVTLQRLSDAETAQIVQLQHGEAPSAEVLALGQGRPGRAFQLLQSDAARLLPDCERALQAAAGGSSLAFAELASNEPERLSRVLDIVQHLLHQAAAPPKNAAPPPWSVGRPAEAWAEAWMELGRLREQAEALRLDATHALVRIGLMLDPAWRRRQANS